MPNAFKLCLSAVITLALSLFNSIAHAHPGHDHDHWLAAPIHALLLSALILLTASVLISVYRKAHMKTDDTKKQ